MSDLTAIDILVSPEDSMKQRASSVNERMLQSVPPPAGFSLDEHHQPHITTLQRYVRTDALPQVFDAVKGVLDSLDLSTLTFTTSRIKHMVVQDGIGLSAIVVKPGSEVLDFQGK